MEATSSAEILRMSQLVLVAQPPSLPRPYVLESSRLRVSTGWQTGSRVIKVLSLFWVLAYLVEQDGLEGQGHCDPGRME